MYDNAFQYNATFCSNAFTAEDVRRIDGNNVRLLRSAASHPYRIGGDVYGSADEPVFSVVLDDEPSHGRRVIKLGCKARVIK